MAPKPSAKFAGWRSRRFSSVLTGPNLQALLREIELMANNGAAALEHYDRAEQLGRPAPSAVAQHIRLLVGQWTLYRRRQAARSDSGRARQLLLGPLYSEILFRTQSRRKRRSSKPARPRKTTPRTPKTNTGMASCWLVRRRRSDVTPATAQRDHGQSHQGHAAGDRIAARIPRRLVRAHQLLRHAEGRSAGPKDACATRSSR